jgi:peptidoglycan hydrolase CwlO-like protein
MYRKKIISVVLSVVLVTTALPPKAVEASWFSDICGGLLTIISFPILLIAPDNPTLRKNNPFRKKLWEEQAEIEERIEKRLLQHPPRIERIVVTEVKNDEEILPRLANLERKLKKANAKNAELEEKFKNYLLVLKKEIIVEILDQIYSNIEMFRGPAGKDATDDIGKLKEKIKILETSLETLQTQIEELQNQLEQIKKTQDADRENDRTRISRSTPPDVTHIERYDNDKI